MLLKMIEDPKSLLHMQVVYIDICCMRKIN
jgi:hypothetical protein